MITKTIALLARAKYSSVNLIWKTLKIMHADDKRILKTPKKQKFS